MTPPWQRENPAAASRSTTAVASRMKTVRACSSASGEPSEAKTMALSMSVRRICSRRPSLPTESQAHAVRGSAPPASRTSSTASTSRRCTSSS
jgi:hypothetical protein